MPWPPYLFVYGTLRAATGTKWSKYLIAASVPVGPGRTRGALFQLDGYPGMTVCAGEDAWVGGEVHLLNDPSSMLAALDDYEGCGPANPLPHAFERRAVTVIQESGRAVEAWAYTYTLDTQDKPRIMSGEAP